MNQLPDQVKSNFIQQGFEILETKIEKYNIRFKIKDKGGNVKEGVAGIDGLVLFVAGYNLNGSHEVYNIHIPGEIIKRRDGKERGMEYGANWIGQSDVVSRIIKGWDVRMLNIPFVNQAVQHLGQQGIENQLNGLEYSINWGTMSLQDAIDFSILAIQTTSAIQRFSDGIQTDPGDVPGVGGPVDVAVITLDKGFVWVSKKNLFANNNVVNLDNYENLKKAKIKKISGEK